MFKVEGTVVINRPIGEIFEFLTKPDNFSQWQGAVLEAKQTSEGLAVLLKAVGRHFTAIGRFH